MRIRERAGSGKYTSTRTRTPQRPAPPPITFGVKFRERTRGTVAAAYDGSGP